MDSSDAWAKGWSFANIEGDSPLGIGNWGHVPETLEWYCTASAAGNGVASYGIAKILEDGYAINNVENGGRIVTTHHLPDHSAAFYWYKRASEQHYTRALVDLARYYATVEAVTRNNQAIGGCNQALCFLENAAKAGDSEADSILAMLYGGYPSGWLKAIPLPPETAKREDGIKAVGFAKAALDLLEANRKYCVRDDTVGLLMKNVNNVPEALVLRSITILAVHGQKAEDVLDAACVVNLDAPPPRQNETLLEQMLRVAPGGGINKRHYSIVFIPGIESSMTVLSNETQAIIDMMSELGVAIQVLSKQPPSVAK